MRDEKEVVVERWYDQAHKGEGWRLRRFIHDWVKLHAMTGTLTNLVAAAHVTAGTGKGSGDSPHFIPLLHATTQRFTVKEVSGDKGYLDEDNLTAVATIGAQPFVAFKINSREMDHSNEHWRRMWAYFDLKKEEFLKHYHRRSNVESTFGAIKAKFGGGVRSKQFVAQQNEVLAKVLLWNLTCIVQAVEEFGGEAEFSRLVLEQP
ncbi:MAG TPA: transposase [Kofleriaceae bacterium]|nr:transposase [Kofleriaceae bacterium]